MFWKPLYNVLAGLFELLVVNGPPMKALAGRKTAVKEAEWVATGPFYSQCTQGEWGARTGYRRTLVEERARLLNGVPKPLEDAHLKLRAVVRAVRGVWARAMLEALLAGQTNPTSLANLACGRLRQKRFTLLGRFTPHHALMLTEALSDLDYLSEAIERVNIKVERRLTPAQSTIAFLDSLPGIGRPIAQGILAELGNEVSRFASPRPLASWAGLCPGNTESAGKRYSGRTRNGSPSLRQTLVEAAHGAARTKDTYLCVPYGPIAARWGRRRALVALAHPLLTSV